MDLPFTRDQLFEVFTIANDRTHMLSTIAGYLGALGWVFLRRSPKRSTFTILYGGLSLLWGWIAIGFFWGPFSSLASSSWPFGGLFLLQSAIFLRVAIRNPNRLPLPSTAWNQRIGIALEVYALVVYPSVGLLTGHHAGDLPWFGIAPCPSTIWTLGVLIGTGGFGRKELMIPLAWCAVGLVAAARLGVVQDWGLGVAAGLAIWLWMAGRPNRQNILATAP